MSGKDKPSKTTSTAPSETTTQSNTQGEQPFTRDTFFRDLKKAAKKRVQPSQRGSKKR